MIEFIKQNITWIKDLVTLIFAGTGTVLAILTYRRARATILQPIRNEVIKKQSELLSEVLSLCHPPSRIDNGVDYVKLVQANVLLHLRDYGFVFRNQPELFDALEKDISGWLPCGESRVLKDVEIIGSFRSGPPDAKNLSGANEVGKQRYEDANKGIISIDKIYLTTQHRDFMEKIQLLSTNPFMPAVIQGVLSQLIIDINKNLKEALKEVIEGFVSEFFQKTANATGYPGFDPTGVYNDFNHHRIHHREMINRLFKETRSYLRIDESWE